MRYCRFEAMIFRSPRRGEKCLRAFGGARGSIAGCIYVLERVCETEGETKIHIVAREY